MDLMNEKMCKYKDCKNRLVPKLLKFIERLKECGFELFRKLGKTMEYWQEEIGRMFRFTKTNGITEGFHRKMKLIQRRAYGFRLKKIIACVLEFYVLKLNLSKGQTDDLYFL